MIFLISDSGECIELWKLLEMGNRVFAK